MDWIDGKAKTHENVGFIEYNPNKVGKEGNAIVDQIRDHCSGLEVVRYDLAIDYPIARETVRLIKDKRKYGCELSDAFTEYLGRRNKVGRVNCFTWAKIGTFSSTEQIFFSTVRICFY